MTDDASNTTVADTPSPVVLSAETAALMDRAVRAARGNNWCVEFSMIAASVFGVPANEVVDSDGYNCKGYDKDGFNAKGWNVNGRNKEGFDQNGFNIEGYDKDGFDRYGLNTAGFDKDGRDKYRFDSDGFDREGYDSYGQRYGGTRTWYARQGTRPEEDFKYDRRGYKRPAKKTVMEKLGFGG